VISVIEAFRDRGLATPFTAEVLGRAGVSETLVSRVLQSMRELELVDENGMPTDTFERLRQARGEEEYKARLLAWLQDTYQEILKFADPENDAVQRVSEAFRGFTPAKQRLRMVTLMLRLFEYAGATTKVATPRESGAPRRVYVGPRSAPRIREPVQRLDPPRIRRLEPVLRVPNLPPGLLGLLQQIPTDGGSWTQQRRDDFLRAFEAVLDFTVRVDDGGKEGPQESDGEAWRRPEELR
jgi:hypothetical protein